MKKLLIFLNFVFISYLITGQSRIEFCEYLLSQTDKTLQWTINGLTFSPTRDEVVIYPNVNGIDTIYFQQTRLSKTIYDTIFSKIPNHTSLVLKIGCCDDMFDLITKKDYDERVHLYETNPSLDFDSLDMSLLQYGKIKFEIFNKPICDTLICSFGGIFNISQMITIEKEYGWVLPCQIGYQDNIIDICIIKLNRSLDFETIEFKDFECAIGTDMVEWDSKVWPLDSEVILKRFGIRIFNEERTIIQYDYVTGNLKLIIEE